MRMKVSLFPLRTAFAIVLICCARPEAASAQAGSGSIDGIVLDASGSVIPRAQITLTREGTGDIRRTSSNEEGFFSFVGMPAGTYTLQVEFAGFGKFTQTGIAIHGGDKITLRDIALKPGTISQDIVVTGSAEEVIPVDSGEKASVIVSKQIQILPS